MVVNVGLVIVQERRVNKLEQKNRYANQENMFDKLFHFTIF